MKFEEREAVYRQEEYYWGTEPSQLAELTMPFLPDDPSGRRAVDIGAGEGRDAVHFAEAGMDVWAVDVSPAGLEKAVQLATQRGVEIHTVEADANDYDPPKGMDLVFSSGAVQYIRPENRPRQFERFKAATTPGGINSIFAFVDHPEIPPAPDRTDNEYPFERDELQDYYADWEPLHTEELIFDDDSGGEPHQHAARMHVARKPSE